MYISRSHNYATIFEIIFLHETSELCVKWCWRLLSVSRRHNTYSGECPAFLRVCTKKRAAVGLITSGNVFESEIDSHSKFIYDDRKLDSYCKYRDDESSRFVLQVQSWCCDRIKGVITVVLNVEYYTLLHIFSISSSVQFLPDGQFFGCLP
jgi:hypothetical protein